MKTRIGIIGAGPAGLLLARILQLNGIDSVILERRDRAYVLARLRAGVLEQGTVDTLRQYGVDERLNREGMPHQQTQFFWNEECHAIAITDEDGRRLTTYGQNKIVEDLITLREADGLPILFNAQVESLDGITSDPVITYTMDGQRHTLECEFIAGCDGYLGVSRRYIPDVEAHSHLHEFPFSWFGILAEAPPSPIKRGFAHHTRGLAVSSARSKQQSRLYLQVDPDFEIDSMTDEQIWDELDLRLSDSSGAVLNRGPIVEKSVARLRAFVCERMQHGKLAIAGDAAHIVPPSGAKGLNLAVGDVRLLAEAIQRHLRGDDALLAEYSTLALRRIWPTVHWSCLMSEALHVFPGQTSFDTRRQYMTLGHWINTEIGRKRFCQAMLGLPYAV